MPKIHTRRAPKFHLLAILLIFIVGLGVVTAIFMDDLMPFIPVSENDLPSFVGVSPSSSSRYATVLIEAVPLGGKVCVTDISGLFSWFKPIFCTDTNGWRVIQFAKGRTLRFTFQSCQTQVLLD